MTPSPSHDTRHITVEDGEAGERIDKFLAAKLPELSRSKLQWLLENGHVRAGGRPLTQSKHKVKAGEVFAVELPPAPLTEVKPTQMPLDIVFEDAHLLVINKPAGLTVHPAAGHAEDTLVNGLLAYCGGELSAIGGEARPGIVHRLDKDTSGLMVVAKTDAAHRILAKQLADRTLSRTYHAIVWGVPGAGAWKREVGKNAAPQVFETGTIETQMGRDPRNRQRMAVLPSGGKEAVTHYTVLEKGAGSHFALVECKLETGRTHQIRVHMAHLGHPLVGDPLYGGRRTGSKKHLPDATRTAVDAFPRQALHALRLGFLHPATHAPMNFEAPLAADIAALWHTLTTTSSFRA